MGKAFNQVQIKVGFFSKKITGDMPIGMGNLDLHIAKRLLRRPDVDLTLFHTGAVHSIYRECKTIRLPGIRPLRLMRYMWPYILQRHGFDVIHFPHNHLLPLRPKPAKCVVLTIHDVNTATRIDGVPATPFHLRYPHTDRALTTCASSIDKIVAVSAFTAGELCKVYGFSEDKVSVVPNGVDLALYRPSREDARTLLAELGLGEQYILHVSTLKPVKNFGRVLKAFGALAGDHPHLLLAVVGGSPERREKYMEQARALGIAARIKYLRRVTNEELVQLYSDASMLVCPSIFEGFGMPVLEAMACGCPVVASNIPPFAEFAAAAAIRVSPYSERAVANGMREILEKPNVRARLVSDGMSRAREYAWDVVVDRLVATYRQTLDGARL